jgi:hypothetical protein
MFLLIFSGVVIKQRAEVITFALFIYQVRVPCKFFLRYIDLSRKFFNLIPPRKYI